MIISYRHRFIFLHSPKTGGSSIKMHFASWLGPHDILLGARKERRAARLRANARARFDALSTRKADSVLAVARSLSGASGRVWKYQEQVYARHFGHAVDHPSAAQIRAFDETAWGTHFKFSFTRNPYERLVSTYLFLTAKAGGERPPFPLFMRRLAEGGINARWSRLIDHWPIHAIDDRIAVDFVGRYERLDDDFRVICDALSTPVHAMPRAKSSPRYDFRAFYDGESRNLVARLCEREIEHFGYRFDA